MTDSFATDRDIDLLLITGAGASREFGVSGKTLPLMGEWSDALVTKLGSGPLGYLDVTRLEKNLDGPEFETRLGTFQRSIDAFFRIGLILEPSIRFQAPAHPSLSDPSVLATWHDRTQDHLIRVQNLIHESLYEQFADGSIDVFSASKAYGWLLPTLGISKAQRLVYATTNYDTIAEQSLGRLGFLPDAGDSPTFGGATESRLDIGRLIEGVGRHVPVLHLHGRVGWYRRTRDDAVYVTNARRHDTGYGTPIVMLPDPEKVYDTTDVISLLWEQFGIALRRAKRVLILGHSLNDQVLLDYIREYVDPIGRVAVTVYPDEGSPDDPYASTRSMTGRIKTEFGGVDVIPLRFGVEPSGADALAKWTDRLQGSGLI